jgi:cell volume regulation protein A
VLILVARPIAAWVSLLPFRFGRSEVAFVGWTGLRGAVSILLAIVPLMSGHSQGQVLFNTAFIVVLLSLVLQGWTVRPAARLLGQLVPARRGPVDRVELALPGEQSIEMVAYTVHAESPVARGQHLPRWARPALVLRGGREIELPATQKLEAGDHLYLFAGLDKVPLLDKLFAGQVELSPEDREFFGDFAVPAATPLGRLFSEYGLAVPADLATHTLAEEFQRSYGAVEVGDRLRLADLELVVTEEEGGEARQVGLVLDPPKPKPPFPFLPSGADLRRWLAGRVQRNRPAPPSPPPIPPGPPA